MESTSPKFFCFVLMPFTNDFDDIYNLGIKGGCKDADAYCERVDEQIFQERILDRIYNQIAKADLIIADMTARNPNVFYEVGYAHALNKPTILLTQDVNDIPFDLKHFPHIIYSNKITFLKEELSKRVSWFKDNIKNQSVKAFKIPIDIYVDGKNLLSQDVIHRIHTPEALNFSVCNNSQFTLKPGEFQIGIISEEGVSWRQQEVITAILPDKRFLHILPFSESALFPGAYMPLEFNFDENDTMKETFFVIIRVFNDTGFLDFPLLIKTQWTNDHFI